MDQNENFISVFVVFFLRVLLTILYPHLDVVPTFDLCLQMAKDLDAILDSQNAVPPKSFICADGSVSYLKQVIFPIYETMAAVGSY